MTEHVVSVRSVRVRRGEFDATFLTDDGDLHEVAKDLRVERERSLDLECSCGRQFDDYSAAADHLRDITARNGGLGDSE